LLALRELSISAQNDALQGGLAAGRRAAPRRLWREANQQEFGGVRSAPPYSQTAAGRVHHADCFLGAPLCRQSLIVSDANRHWC
jgi:hypothetical protein